MVNELDGIASLLPEAMLLVAADGAVRAANVAAGELLGLAPAELAGRGLSELTTDSAEAVGTFLRACSRSNRLVPATLTLALRDGSHVPCRCHGAVLHPRSGDAPAVILVRLISKEAAVNQFVALNQRIEALTREILRRRRAEEAMEGQKELLRVTLASIGDAVIATDTQGCVTFMNPVAELHTGWGQAEAAGRPLAEIFVIVNEDTRAPVDSPVAEVLARGTIVGLANHTVLIRRDGTELPIDDCGAPIRSESGKLLGVVLVFHDVEERRHLERQLQQEAHKLLQADRRKDEFLAMLAHELRNPLAPLRNGIEVLRTSCAGNGPVERVGAMMERQVHHLSRLVDDLLDVSRFTRGKIDLQRQPLSLRSVLERALEMVRPTIDARDHELTVTLPPKSLRVDADGARLSQVFVNLLTNAAKFTPPGGQIHVSGRQEKKGQAIVRVRDTGIGIAPDLLPAVFELFTQADRSLDRSQGGLGVGLTLVRALVELHGGSVEAHSAGAEQGSELIVRLPTIESKGPDAAAGGEGSTPPRAAAASRRVLVVDDNVDAAESLSEMLRLWHHDVRTAHAGPEALETVRSFEPEVVLLDIGLPGMDGYELARRLRTLPATSPAVFVALTGYGLEEDRRKSKEAGFDHHLTKPVSLDVLEDLLARQ